MADGKVTRRQFVRTGAAAAAGVAAGISASRLSAEDKTKILNYNENMEYRPCGKTGLTVSAVCLGGHWKRVNKMVPGVFGDERKWLSAKLDMPAFQKNRYEVVTRCMEVGINYIDACTWQECMAYSKALEGRRDKMYLGFSWYQEEMRKPQFRTEKALLGTLDKGMSQAKLDYVDLWRITMLSKSSQHTEAEVEQMMKALVTAKKQGKARFIGFSSHDRNHIKWMIETYPDVVDAFCTPYTAKTKEMPGDSLFETVKKHNVGWFGIKPFANNTLFKGDATLESEHAQADDRLARLAIRYILCNPTITAPIPGMINTHQVDNVAKAVAERRKLDLAEARELEQAMDRAWARLPEDYQWLKDWEYV